MESFEEGEYPEVQYCFPSHNSSCTKEVRSRYEYIIMYVLFSSISFFTVFVNLLVIISISHFRQLHTPTNLLILSLAVGDFLVGIIVIPVESIKLIESCWYFGKAFCFIFQLIVYTLISVSLSNLVFIAVDRYVAVCYPLKYPSIVTVSKTVFYISLSWLCSLIYNQILLYCNDHVGLVEEGRFCHGQCVLPISYICGLIDLIVSFIFPCSIMITLYFKIFKVAKYQAQVIHSITTSNRFSNEVKTPKKSERKAAKTLGVVIVAYLLCWIPYYICLLTEDTTAPSSVVITFLSWVLYTNSCLNPVIYALFYPWFKRSVKHIITFTILESSSSFLNLLPENI